VPWVPLSGSLPPQAPEAVQAVALVEDQFNAVLPPLATLLEPTLRDTLGGADDTVTVADCDAEPPGPVQVSVYFVVALTAAVVCEPLVDSVPLHPPDARHEVALVEDQVSVDVAPLLTVLGLAERVKAGVV
jgi:hypothetical protein